MYKRQEHELTHHPYQSWCSTCVAARGRDRPHGAVTLSGVPVIQIDYTFLRSDLPNDTTSPVLIGYALGSGYAFGWVVRCKGRGDLAAIRSLAAWLLEAGFTTSLRLRSDSESSIQSVARAVAGLRSAPTILETSPIGSSSSLGGAERWAETLAGLVRCYRADLLKRVDIAMKSSDVLLSLIHI